MSDASAKRPQKKRQSADERDRIAVETACNDLAEQLTPLVGFVPHVEPVNQVFLTRGGGISLQTMRAIVAALALRSADGSQRTPLAS